jgi:hypothetical protein
LIRNRSHKTSNPNFSFALSTRSQTNRWIIEKEWKCFSMNVSNLGWFTKTQRGWAKPFHLKFIFFFCFNVYMSFHDWHKFSTKRETAKWEQFTWCKNLLKRSSDFKSPACMDCWKQSKLLKSSRWTIYARMNELPFTEKTQIHSTCIITRDGIFQENHLKDCGFHTSTSTDDGKGTQSVSHLL